VFTSLEAVHQHNREIEKKKIEKEMKKSMKQDMLNKVVSVNNSTMLACNLCNENFYNQSALKKHERDVHERTNSLLKESLDYHNQFSKPNFPHNNKVVSVNNSTMLPCNLCDEKFYNRSALKKHERDVHNQFSNFPYNNREVESHMVESVFNRNVVQGQGLRLAKSEDPKIISASGISVSGLSVNKTKPDLSNVRLERNTQTPLNSEPVSKLSKLKDVSFSRKPKHHQPLGPEIMEQYMVGPSSSKQNFLQAKDFEPRREHVEEDKVAQLKAEYRELTRYQLYQKLMQEKQKYQSLPQTHQQNQMFQAPPLSQQDQNLFLQSSQRQPLQPQPPPPHKFSQLTPSSVEPRRPTPISGEEMIQALKNRNENFQAKRRDVSFPIRRGKEASRSVLRKVVKKVDLKPKPVRKKKIVNPNYSSKHLITVSMACKYLGLKDYPVPVNDFNKKFFENENNFEAYFLPLVASVNQGANPLSIQTLVKAKYLEVKKAKPGEFRSLYFNKPRRNRVKVNVVS